MDPCCLSAPTRKKSTPSPCWPTNDNKLTISIHSADTASSAIPVTYNSKIERPSHPSIPSLCFVGRSVACASCTRCSDCVPPRRRHETHFGYVRQNAHRRLEGVCSTEDSLLLCIPWRRERPVGDDIRRYYDLQSDGSPAPLVVRLNVCAQSRV